MKWNAYYFDNLSAASKPVRVQMIEAEDEEEAGKIAIAAMGRSMRVNVARPIWAECNSPVDAEALPWREHVSPT
jgi:hypothetical protein